VSLDIQPRDCIIYERKRRGRNGFLSPTYNRINVVRIHDGVFSHENKEIRMNDDDFENDYTEDEKHESRLLVRAYLTFTSRFSEYIREVDESLWNKAIDYAKDYTTVDGVVLTDVRHLMDIDPEEIDGEFPFDGES
jgi:hypothetical protein